MSALLDNLKERHTNLGYQVEAQRRNMREAQIKAELLDDIRITLGLLIGIEEQRMKEEVNP